MTTAGERLRCGQCGTEIIVVKASDAPLSCCGQPMDSKAQEGAAGGQ